MKKSYEEEHHKSESFFYPEKSQIRAQKIDPSGNEL